MKFDLRRSGQSVAFKRAVAVVGAMTALGALWGGAAQAEPGQDALKNLTELSRQAEQLTETIQSAQRDLDDKLRLLAEADARHAADLAAFDAAQAQLDAYQGRVDTFLASVYMGGRTDEVTAILTAASPASLIDKMSVQRVLATDMSRQMQGLRRAHKQAQTIQVASAVSMVEARAAADAAATVRADLLEKQALLRKQMDEAAEQAVLAAPPAAVMAALGYAAPIPTVGMNGLVPNARRLVAYIMATYPGVRSIGGVRSDPLPDHPSGRAIDIMLTDMALGDAINADIQRQSARFGVSYTMWRVAAHFDHIHVTVS